MTGRNGTVRPAHPQTTSPRNQVIKTERAEDVARDARRAVDSFTAGIEQAMRGQQRGHS